MGFIKKLIGGIFAFLGGLFGGLGKLVGLGGSKSGYFLEADSDQSTVAAASAPAPAAATTVAAASKVKTDASLVSATVATEPSLNGKVVAEPVPAATKPAESAPAPVPVAAASTTTFAPNFLVSANSGGRRRPGPSMNPFLDMARQVKTQG